MGYSILVENLEHCDFVALRNMVVRTHLQDLKDVTNNVHYENFRCRKLAGLGPDGKPVKGFDKYVYFILHDQITLHDDFMIMIIFHFITKVCFLVKGAPLTSTFMHIILHNSHIICT